MYKKNNNPTQHQTEEKAISQNSYFCYLSEISKYKLLSLDEEISLFQRIQDGDNVAKDLFIKSNLRLVLKEAKKYYVPGHNDLLDLIQEGNMGLIRAVDQFDLTKGCKFSTYAVYVINKAIQSAPLRSGLPLEIPQNKLALINKIRRAIDTFESQNGRKPSYAELSSILKVSSDSIVAMMPFITTTVSLNTKLNQEQGENSKEVIDVFDEYYREEPEDPETTFIVNETKDAFRDIINEVLNDKEKTILFSRWGLFDSPVKDVATLAAELNMTKQGIRQCEERSIGKLKRHLLSLNKSLLDFI